MTIGLDKSEFPPCRLCGGMSSFQFSHLVLKKYPTKYWRCEGCGCLQTDPPHWLDESYQSVHSAGDTGMVARTLRMAQLTSLLLRLAGVDSHTQCLDWGGGNGLFCRMMRDQAYNFVTDDKYVEPFYCAGFTRQSVGAVKSDIVTSFEVFEHLPTPRMELAEILAFDPKLWIFSTQLYATQDRNWKYLGPDLGRHVFFYSERGLRKFAGEHGFDLLRGRDMHMLVRRSGHNYLQGSLQRYAAARLLAGAKPETFAAALNFQSRQRRAYQYWRADSAAVRQEKATEKRAV